MTPIVVRALTKRFGQTPAVVDVDLDIAPGELFFLLGPSGCGKTTLLRTLAGFVEPASGSIAFGEKDVTHTPASERSCGMVFQNYALWPHLTVRQNVAFGLDVRRVSATEKRRRVDEALDMVRLAEARDRKPNELSGGQQQRVALARALVIRPAVLLLDEPLSNLDARLRQHMREEIRQICRQSGITTVYVTHDQKEALAMADRIALMRRGRIVQIDSPWQLYQRPTNRFAADFLGEANFFDGRVLEIHAAHVTVDTLVGSLRSGSFPEGIAVGQAVICCLRPEVIRVLGEGDASGENVLKAVLEDTVYLGEAARHRARVNQSTTLFVYELNPKRQHVTDIARDCAIGFAPEDLVILAQ